MSGRYAREVVLVEAVRTPIGKGHPTTGVFRDTHATTLLASVLKELVHRAGISPREVGSVHAGCAQPYGEQAYNVARHSWLEAGLPVEVPSVTVDCQCGSAQQAVNIAVGLVAAGVDDVAIGAGVEHMGHVPLSIGWTWGDDVGSPWSDPLRDRYQLVMQGESAEMLVDHWDIKRGDLDALALRSHQLAATATDEGRFERELVQIMGADGPVTADQGIRRDTTLERLGNLRPAFREEGTITAGTSSQISDGAAAVLVMSREKADELGVEPRARIVDQALVGVDPVMMLTGPIEVTRSLLERNGLTIEDIDLFEVNEAFASVVLAWQRETGADPNRVNVNGGAMALGHPLGGSGARLLTTLLHELERADKEFGLATLCCAGGLGTGTLIQRL